MRMDVGHNDRKDISKVRYNTYVNRLIRFCAQNINSTYTY